MTMRATFADVVPAVGFEPVVDGRTFDVGISEFAGSSSEGVIPETMSKSPPTGSSACREDEGGVTGVSGADPFVRYIGPLSKSSQSGLIRGESPEDSLQQIEARLVASGEQMRDGGRIDFESFGELPRS